MDLSTYYSSRKRNISRGDPAVPEGKGRRIKDPKKDTSKSVYGPNVGRVGGNPQYKKNVI
jgi:hypothetical protein